VESIDSRRRGLLHLVGECGSPPHELEPGSIPGRCFPGSKELTGFGVPLPKVRLSPGVGSCWAFMFFFKDLVFQ
jgi:hypothetical protein